MTEFSMQAFLNTLFDPDQRTCFAKTGKGMFVKPRPGASDVYFCINALDPERDHDWERSTSAYASPDRPRRADANVVCYRNFCIEIDELPLEEQIEYVTKKIPVTSIVYSGGKSHHFIISLKEPLKNKEEYDEFASRLLQLFTLADPMVKNCSTLSRLPFRFRQDKKKKQKLVHLGERIDFNLLNQILPKAKPKQQFKVVQGGSDMIPANVIFAKHNPDDMMATLKIDGRNSFFFWLGQRLKESTLSLENRIEIVETTYNNLKNTSGFSLAEAKMAARL